MGKEARQMPGWFGCSLRSSALWDLCLSGSGRSGGFCGTIGAWCNARPVSSFPAAKGLRNLSRMRRFWRSCGAARAFTGRRRSTTIPRSASPGRICRGGCSAFGKRPRISPFRLRHNAAERKKKGKQHEKTYFGTFTGTVHDRVARGMRRCGRYRGAG